MKKQNVPYCVTVNIDRRNARQIANTVALSAMAIAAAILYVNGKI